MNDYTKNININNILKDISIDDGIDSNIVEYTNNVFDNNIIISELANHNNSYVIYYNDNEKMNLMTYVIQEGNGLYNYKAYNSMFFNIDDHTIKESYNKIFVNTNALEISNDDKDIFGISYVNTTYLNNKNNGIITLDSSVVSYFINNKNQINYLHNKCIDLYNKITYYKLLNTSSNTLFNSNNKINYDYKYVTVKYLDNYYFSSNILDKKYNSYYVTLPNDSKIIYFKDINSLKIKLDIESDYSYNLQLNNIININTNRYQYSYSDIYAILESDYETDFANISADVINKTSVKYKEYDDYSPIYMNTTYNNIYMLTNTKYQQEKLNKYGTNINIKIVPNISKYIDTKYIDDYNIKYNEIYNKYYDEPSYINYEHITYHIPKNNSLTLIYDNRNINYGVSLYNKEIENSYICILSYKPVNSSNETIDISFKNQKLINKLLDEKIIWFNYDPVIHYGYNYSYINNNNTKYIKKYVPIMQNLSTQIINYHLLKNYLAANTQIPNIDTIDINNTITTNMDSYIYNRQLLNNRSCFIYKYNDNKLIYIDTIVL